MQVGIRELKARLSEFVARATRGETIIVTDRGQPVADLIPHRSAELPQRMTELVRQGRLILASKPRIVPQSRARMRRGQSLADIVVEERRRDRLSR